MPNLTYPAPIGAATLPIASWLTSARELGIRAMLSPDGALELGGSPPWIASCRIVDDEVDQWITCHAQVRDPSLRTALVSHISDAGVRLPNAWIVLSQEPSERGHE